MEDINISINNTNNTINTINTTNNNNNTSSLDDSECSNLLQEEGGVLKRGVNTELDSHASSHHNSPQHHSTTTTTSTSTRSNTSNSSPEKDRPVSVSPSSTKTTNKATTVTVQTTKFVTTVVTNMTSKCNNPIFQKFGSIVFTITCFAFLQRFLRPSAMEEFLSWMEVHPIKGIIGYTLIYPFHMIFFFPGTPLVMGGGFVFKLRFGWVGGVLLCSIVSLFGSLIGSVMCFLLGRYWIRGIVRRWAKKYPIFDAIDAAVSENGFKIMCMLYLTPIIPLGPTSYMMGTTSMPLVDFAKAKIAALPLTMLYVYLGAAAGTLLTEGNSSTSGNGGNSITGGNGGDDSKHLDGKKITINTSMESVSLPPQLIIIGILISVGSIALITVKMKKELQKTLGKQKGRKDGDTTSDTEMNKDEMGLQKQSTGHTRQRYTIPKKSSSTVSKLEMI